tara:strand:+ start:765 stop:1010 length:246 start_codon:yes stop_codon:yes gene_type:complete
MLNQFLKRLKAVTLSQRVNKLEEEVRELRAALIKTQNVLSDVTRAQAEFLAEFEMIIRMAQEQSSADYPPDGTKGGTDIWN